MESTLSLLMSGVAAAAAAAAGDVDCDDSSSKAPLHLCSWPEELEGNCTLQVAGVPVAVNKTYLSMHSPIFHRMFYGDFYERANDRYEVKEVCSAEFIEMLRVILPTRKPIDVDNVEYLLVLADRFMMDHLRKDCIQFLCSETRGAAPAIHAVVLIVIAFRYGVEELKSRVSASLFSQDSIVNLRHHARFDEITDEARCWLFNLMLIRPASTSMKRVLCNDRCRHFDTLGRCTVCGRAELDL